MDVLRSNAIHTAKFKNINNIGCIETMIWLNTPKDDD